MTTLKELMRNMDSALLDAGMFQTKVVPEHNSLNPRRAADKRWRERNPAAVTASNKVRSAVWRANNIGKTLLLSAARTKKYECTVSLEEVETLLAPGVCSMTHIPWRWDRDRPYDLMAPSLDRIDNDLGHVPGNIRVVLWVVNKMRGKMSEEEFLTIARALVRVADENG